MRARDLFEGPMPTGPMPTAPQPTKAPPGKPMAPPLRRQMPTRRPDPFRRNHPGVNPKIKPKAVAGPAGDGREMAMGEMSMGGMNLESKGQQLARHLLEEA